MAVLETIRNKFGILITVLIAVALLSFIIDPSSLSAFFGSQQQEEVVGEIDGEEITYTEFHNEWKKFTDMYGNPQTPEQTAQLRDMVWGKFLLSNYYVVKAKEAGFNVSEEEVYQMLSMQMTPDQIIQMEEQANADPAYKEWWDSQIEDMKNNIYMSKYAQYFVKSDLSNPLLVEDEISSSNDVFDVEFVLVPYTFAADSTIVVSEKEISDFYNSHLNSFRQEETRDIEYVVIEVKPSEDDLLAAQAENESITLDSLMKVTPPSQETLDIFYEKAESILAKSTDLESFQKAAIDEGYYAHSNPNMQMTSYNLGAVSGTDKVTKWAFDASKGEISEIFTVGNNYIIAAVKEINPKGHMPLEKVSAMIKFNLTNEKSQQKQTEEVAAAIAGLTDLTAIAEALGTTVSTSENVSFGSDLDPKFVGAASVAETGVVSAPLKGSLGVYVYKVTNRDEKAFYTEDDAKNTADQRDAMYMQMLPYVLGQQGNITNRTPLYF